MTNIAIVGASGFTGLELTKILAKHPKIQNMDLFSFNNAGKKISEFSDIPSIKNFVLQDFKEINFNAYQVIFFACPNGTAMKYTDVIDSNITKVIDLAADYRLDDEKIWESFYGIKHKNPQLLSTAVYGIPEINRDKIKQASLLANPGCYPTAAIIALYPLIKNGLIETKNIIIDAKSGYSGAGREKIESELGEKISNNFIPYNFFKHRHNPEITQELAKVSKEKIDITFSPHILPLFRGILETIYVRKTSDVPDEIIEEAFQESYSSEEFINFEKSKYIEIKDVVNTNNVLISYHHDDSNRLVITSAIDNLIKGAAGQAVQNMNIMMEFDELSALNNE